MVSISWSQALAWRMRRHLLDPRGQPDAAAVVQRLAGVQAQVASAAELAVAVRQENPVRGAVEAAEVVKTWAMRGTLHLLPVEEAGAYLSLLASLRFWERPAWQRAFGASPGDVDALTAVVAETLDGRVLTREELVAEVVARTGSRHLEEVLRSGWGTLLKPVAWRGYLCHGPPQGNRVTFTRPASRYPRWREPPPPEEAARTVIRAYLRAHGPATPAAFNAWLSRGAARKSTVASWFAAMRDELASVDVEGETCYVLAADLDELAAQPPSASVRLLPGFDQYVLGPGTGSEPVVPAARRAAVSRAAGWIAPVVVAGGRVAGTWSLEDDGLAVGLFEEVPRDQLVDEAERIAGFLGRDLVVTVTVA